MKIEDIEGLYSTIIIEAIGNKRPVGKLVIMAARKGARHVSGYGFQPIPDSQGGEVMEEADVVAEFPMRGLTKKKVRDELTSMGYGRFLTQNK